MSDKHQDVALILKLYELRREEGLRRARKWYFTEFNPQSAGDVAKLLGSGHDGSANFRMITSYWEMAASFVNNGGIDEKMFIDANGEHVGVFCRVEPFLEELRQIIGLPEYLKQLETLVKRTPNVDQRLERFRGIFSRWSQAAKETTA
ncbi:MAG: hypothetical protein DMF61_02070 [Blastocatellia bacterium AA13]|nr:MAG: hypothetical protein DMF61_02070 [Blastocatellia bacterium AA13]